MSARTDLCGGRSAMIVPTATSPKVLRKGKIPRLIMRFAGSRVKVIEFDPWSRKSDNDLIDPIQKQGTRV